MPLAIDSLGPWGFVLLAIYIVGFVLYLAFFYGRGKIRQQRADRLEIDGSWSSFVAECSERRNRAEARHNRRAA